MEETQVLHELHKLSQIESEETLNQMLCTLWSTRKTGLPLSDKSHFQSLLHLPSPSHLDPVLACLRSLVRKCAHQNLARDDLLRLFPRDLPIQLQTNLVSALQRNRDRWKEDVSHVIPQLKGTINFAPSLLWPRQEQDFDAVAVPAVVPDVGPSGVNSCFQCDAVGASDNLVKQR
uniref:Uncharacterized protein n=1 Tax=Glycine max TaxID=3847 RepID=A0A0R0EXK6_SOYBN